MFTAFKLLHAPTGVECCTAAFLTHARRTEVFDGFPGPAESFSCPSPWEIPNLVLTKGNVLEVYNVQTSSKGHASDGSMESSRAWLELVCEYRLHGNVEDLTVLRARSGTDGQTKRDAIVLTSGSASVSVLEFDDATNGLVTSSLHYYEGKEWAHLKGGKESFARGPSASADPEGRCAAVILYEGSLAILLPHTQERGSTSSEAANSASHLAGEAAYVQSSYIVTLRDYHRVRDFTFLEGCSESPCVALLQEKVSSWSGRAALSKFTHAVSVISVDTSVSDGAQRSTAPVPTNRVWASPVDLPFDSYKLVSVPAPIGGVLALGANGVHYLNQDTYVGLALNNHAFLPPGRQDTPKSSVSVELGAAHATWVLPTALLLSTKTGALMLLSLFHQDRVVTRLDLRHHANSILTSCVCTVGSSFLFLGSRLGDSTLIQFATSSSASPSQEKANGENLPALKRQKIDAGSDESAMDMDEVEAGQRGEAAGSPQMVAIRVRDSLVNIGPVRDFAFAPRVPGEGEDACGFHEMVACSGHEKNGALSVLHRAIYAHLLTEADVQGRGVWTVYQHRSEERGEGGAEAGSAAGEDSHAFIIIGQEKATRVLDESLGEVTESVEFATDQPTIAAGNLCSRRLIVQVHPQGLWLLDGAVCRQKIVLGSGAGSGGSEAPVADGNLSIAMASIADPFVVLKLTDGSLRLVTADPATCQAELANLDVPGLATDAVTAFSTYHDRAPSRWMAMTSRAASQLGGRQPRALPRGPAPDGGDVYCVMCRQSGRLEIYSLPDMALVYSCARFALGPRILADQPKSMLGAREEAFLDKFVIEEVCLEAWGSGGEGEEGTGAPFLVATTSAGTLMCYRSYSYPSGSLPEASGGSGEGGGRLAALRFVKHAFEWIETAEEKGDMPEVRQRIVRFGNSNGSVRGVGGMFVCGKRPLWMFAFRQRMRFHPQYCPDQEPIVAFAPLHIPTCEHGLVFITAKGSIKVCHLLQNFELDNCWPVHKIPLRATPHQVAYCSELKMYAVATSTKEDRPAAEVLVPIGSDFGDPMMSSVRESDGDEALVEMVAEEVAGDTLVASESFELRMYAPGDPTWENRQTYKLSPTENVLVLKEIRIKNHGRGEELETLLAVGTCFVAGEDVPARGRLILFRMTTTPPPHDNSSSDGTWVTEVFARELLPHKGPICQLAALQGNLLAAVGTRIVIHTWDGSGVNAIALLTDTEPVHTVALSTLKNYILVGDVVKSVHFLQWSENQDQGYQLRLLGKDTGTLHTLAAEFFVDGKNLLLMASDMNKNIQAFLYKQVHTARTTVERLLVRSQFHVGAAVAKMKTLPMLTSGTSARLGRNALLFATLDGSIGCLAQVDEVLFKRLHLLQQTLVDAIPHAAGLNPEAFRSLGNSNHGLQQSPENILDCELLAHYEMLEIVKQHDLAKEVKSSRKNIVSNLRDIAIGTRFLAT